MYLSSELELTNKSEHCSDGVTWASMDVWVESLQLLLIFQLAAKLAISLLNCAHVTN